MPALETADEVVMAVEVPVVAALNEPGATTGTTSHIAGDGNHSATPMLPAFPDLRGTELIPKCVMQNSRNQYVLGFA